MSKTSTTIDFIAVSINDLLYKLPPMHRYKHKTEIIYVERMDVGWIRK